MVQYVFTFCYATRISLYDQAIAVTLNINYTFLFVISEAHLLHLF